MPALTSNFFDAGEGVFEAQWWWSVVPPGLRVAEGTWVMPLILDGAAMLARGSGGASVARGVRVAARADPAAATRLAPGGYLNVRLLRLDTDG